MAVYVDQPFVLESIVPQAFRVGAKHGHVWCHLFADTPEELHALAARIGMRREWCDEDPDGGHYDLTPPKRAAAIRAGAIEVDTFTAVAIWNVTRALKLARETGISVAEILARYGGRVPRSKALLRRGRP